MVSPFFMCRLIVILALLLSSAAAQANYVDTLLARTREKKLWQDIQWLDLLHYQKRWFGGYKSQADGMAFFLAPDGKTNPQTELEATIRGFFRKNSEPLAQHPQCQFPARLIWLKRVLAIDPAKLPQERCKRFNDFKQAVAAKSVTVVFSSYYLNNPASAFGHSFLRINKTESAYAGKRYELLDYGINYAANVNTSNALMYAISGIFGFFPGTFTSMPYYYKVREYNDFEARDLWEYDLNMTQAHVDMLVAHAWELGSTYFNYYYFDENCSYHVLTMLDAANPKLNLAKRLGPIVIPADTIKVLMNTPGLVARVHYRPSGRAQFNARLNTLDSKEFAYLKKLADSDKNSALPRPDGLTQAENVHALDAAIDYADFKFHDEILKTDSLASRWKQKLLMARARIRVPSADLNVPTPINEMPHVGHDSRRLWLDYGSGGTNDRFSRAHFRYAMHDLLDPMDGYPSYAQIEIFNLSARYNFDAKSWWLDDFELFQATSLSPLSAFTKQLSWRVKLGARTVRDYTCAHCLAGDLLAGAGYTIEPSKKLPFDLFGMIEAEEMGSSGFDRFAMRTGIGPSLGLRLPVTSSWISLAHASYKQQFPTHKPWYFEFGFESRYSFVKNFALDFAWLRVPVASEFSAGALYYF